MTHAAPVSGPMSRPHGMLIATILGCGSSAGVPRPALGWGACDPANPKNRRRRCSLLVERHAAAGTTRVLVDTSPDLREQLLDANVDELDAIFITHEHADQLHGIDDLRSVVMHMRRRIPVYFSSAAARDILTRFSYIFRSPPGSLYPPLLDEHRIEAGDTLTISGKGGAIPVRAFGVDHGDIPALGFRFGGLAYTPDLHAIPDDSLPALADLDIWIVDALRYISHGTHFSVKDALDWIARLNPARAILTNMNSDLDYASLMHTLPPHVVPAHDGLQMSLPIAD